MAYAVKELVLTLQGEGVQVGRAAVLVRFAGCNLWSGLDRDRETAICRFCDTEFVGTDGQGGGRFATAADLARAVGDLWPVSERRNRYTFLTGGEPLLQMDEPLLDALHGEGFEIGIETNGTLVRPPGVDWVCVSPKAGTELVITQGDELKLVFPQPGAEPERYVDLQFDHFLLQPMDGPDLAANTKLALAYCLTHPQWRLSLQTHKILHIP